MNYFDYKPEVRIAYCCVCGRQTRQSRGHERALFTCLDPQHVHPTREQQAQGITRPGPSRKDRGKRKKRGGPKHVGEVLSSGWIPVTRGWCMCDGEPPCPVGTCPVMKANRAAGPEDFGGKDY